MAEISRSALLDRLNDVATRSLEGAIEFCSLRGNPYVELVHWLSQIFRQNDSDLHRIVRHFSRVDMALLATDLASTIDNLPRGAGSLRDLSQQLEEAVQRGWVYGVLMFNEQKIRTGHLLVGILNTPVLKNTLFAASGQFRLINADELAEKFFQIAEGSPETPVVGTTEATSPSIEPANRPMPAVMGKRQALDQFTVDLTDAARKGELDAVTGRENEVRQLVDILMRRRQNNPILTGEAGVGKTAVVEGFAQRVVAGDVPPPLRDVEVRSLDLGLMQAGASMKGEFEKRLRQLIDEVQASAKPIILFIDEAHTLIGAGGAEGQGDAANLLKPALARGRLRTIAATTWSEYKKYIEKDPALTRRFQVVKVEEPSEETAIRMLRGLLNRMEDHHKVKVLDEGLQAAVRLSHRYIPARQLPDKAVSLLDTACARVAVSQHAVPAEVEDTRRQIAAIETELGILDRETKLGADHATRRAELQNQQKSMKDSLNSLEGAWKQEADLLARILETRNLIVDDSAASTSSGRLDGLKSLEKELVALQGERPLVLPSVGEQAVAAVVEGWTGIPVGRMVKNEIDAVLNLTETLEKRVIGQRHALTAVGKRIQTSRAGLDNPSRPIGVFLLVGPSGVGKTETALSLADTLYGGEQNLITINMSEFQEAHTVSTLKGSPPGYVGYGEGGVLTEAVRRCPYSVVLLDEVEKAHPDVHELFFQVFDKGIMEDGEGRQINFKNTIILLTSNVGSNLIMNMCREPDLLPTPEGIAKALREPLLKVFPAALLGRITVVPYYPIDDSMLQRIIRLQLSRIEQRLAARYKASLTYDDTVISQIAARCTETESGARAVDAILTHTLLPEISREFLLRLRNGSESKRVHISANDGSFGYTFN